MAGLLQGLLDGLARAEPSQRLATVDLLSPEERRHLACDFNPAVPPLAFSSLAEALARRVADDPAATAVEDGPEHIDYGELDRRSARVARALLRAGAMPGQVIGLCMERRAAPAPSICRWTRPIRPSDWTI
jgi:non-ribosomal peptide synthetase component F